MTPSTALLIVDVQRDFLPGGALGVAEGDAVVAPLLQAAAEADFVVASRDWHPHDHCSFDEAPRYEDMSWPAHCVAGERGSELEERIAKVADLIVDKATERDEEAYSPFQGTGLADELRSRGVERLLVGGLATDYCVRAAVLDATKEGFEVTWLKHASRAVDSTSEVRVEEEFRRAGVEVREA